VDDLDEHQSAVLEEFGRSRANLTFTNPPGTNGRTVTWQSEDGVRHAIAFARSDPDERIARERLAHEKYHALCFLAPTDVERLHRAIEDLGFMVAWDQHDEEARATLVELVALHREGVALEDMSGDEVILRSIDVLRDSRHPRAGR
jgi:hypothetical protein